MIDQLPETNHVEPKASGRVRLTPSAARRLYRLSARAELANEQLQREQAALIEAIAGIFEDAGVPYTPQDQVAIDWRAGTIGVVPREQV